jgi:RNA polymerase sigma-70 factor (ECF subfamily)
MMTVLDQIEAAIPALRRYAHALVRDRARADDLVQDCLERAVAKRHLWRGDGPLQAWLYRILLNRHRDLIRAAGPPGHLVAVQDLAAEPAHSGGQEAHLALAEVHAAMGRLPPDQRAALLIVALEGRSFDEAASILDIPKGTLMSRIARARATLRVLTGRTEGSTGPHPANGQNQAKT